MVSPLPPEFPEFESLEPCHRCLFERYARTVRRDTCEFAFANLMIWRDFDRPTFTSMGGSLCIRIDPLVGRPFFLEPLGSNEVSEAVRACICHTGKVSMASSGLVSLLGGNGFRIRPLPEHFDYIYRTKDIAEMKGRRFDGKRNHIKRMRRLHPSCEYVELGESDAEGAIGLFDEWARAKRERGGGLLPRLAYECQRDSVRRAFEYFDELGLMGGALVIDGVMAGFIVGSRLRDDMACAHLCYARPGIAGAFPTLLQEACRRTLAQFELINLEQDMGLAGLRKNKLSFHPLRVEEKFEIAGGGR